MQHARHAHIVDVASVPESKFSCLILDAAGTDDPWHSDRDVLAMGDCLNRIEDLDIARAAAQVGSKVAPKVVAGERFTFLVDQRLCAHDDAGGAEATLGCPVGSEGICVTRAFFGIQSFECCHRMAGHFLQRKLAADASFAVDEHSAGAALARRRTTILRRVDSEFFAKRREHVGMAVPHPVSYTHLTLPTI